MDAQRVAAVLEDCVDRLGVLMSLEPDVVGHRDDLAMQVGVEISKIIEDQHGLEARYEDLIVMRNVLKSMQNRTKYHENQQKIEEVARELRHSTRVLCRNLKENPNVAENLMKIQTERASLLALLSRSVRELRDDSFRTLITVVADGKAKQDALNETIMKEKEAAETIGALSKQLQEVKKERMEVMVKLTDRAREVKQQLAELRARTQVETGYIRREADARTEHSKCVFQQYEKDLLAEKAGMERELNVEARVTSDLETFLISKQQQLMEEKEMWVSKYESDMTKLEQQVAELRASRAETLRRQKLYTERFRECEEFVMTERLRRQRIRDRRASDEERNVSATRIQSWWRGTMCRHKLQRARQRKGRKRRKAKSQRGRSSSRGRPSSVPRTPVGK